MINKILRDKRILSLYIIVIFSLVIGVTYALGTYSMNIGFNTGIIRVDEEAYGDTTFDATNIDFKPILDVDVESSIDNVIKIDFTVGGAAANNNPNIIYDIALSNLDIDCKLLSPYIKWKLIKDGIKISEGSLDYKFDTIKNKRLVLTNIQEDLPNYNADKVGYHSYTFYMWFSDSCQKSNIAECIGHTDQSSLIGKYFSGRIEVELYTEGKKELIRNPSDKLNMSTCNNNKIPSVPFKVNAPNLDEGNLIPVYYDEDGTYEDTNGNIITGVWKKADSTNANNSWYDYENKMWANAVIVDPNAAIDYSNIEVDDIVEDLDILAFYVWIPRFKYRVWNLNRQATSEDGTGTSVYSYPAYTKGIDIKFEKEDESTGNISCNYNIANTEPATILSDLCTYNSGSNITKDDLNTNYSYAWYTHPAFTFGGKEKEGFWVGKFETNGSEVNPTIIPDSIALTNQNLSTQFTTSKKFQNYLSDNIDAHMLTNLEWGAVAYLTHSVYGLCNDSGCEGLKHNNSSSYYTGRSGGAIAGSSELQLNNVYGTSSVVKYNAYGYYDYKGYKLNSSDGSQTSENFASKIASTTSNVTGVYDMSGGAYEYVMGNMVNSSNEFYPSSAGTNWNGNSTLDPKYYNSYSYGTNNSGNAAFNRARLGDATTEVLGNFSTTGAWKVGSGISGVTSNFISYYNYSSSSWFYRGGNHEGDSSGIFYFYRYSGMNASYFSFRSSLI